MKCLEPGVRYLFAGAVILIVTAVCLFQDSRAEDNPADDSSPNGQAEGQTEGAARLDQPTWDVGDRWIIETLTRKIQGREDRAANQPARVRWQFVVSEVEPVAGRDCYRIDIECLAKGRIRPKTSIWCDKETLFLRQFRTQLAVGGNYRNVHESYDTSDGTAAVLAPLSALPLGLPAFPRQGAKGTGTFTYTSQPLPAGAKDPTILRFAHQVDQLVQPAGEELLKQVPEWPMKDLAEKPVREVRLNGPNETVVQLWQQGSPWPVYVDNGHTRAWLVTE